jgi:hypothetical protein
MHWKELKKLRFQNCAPMKYNAFVFGLVVAAQCYAADAKFEPVAIPLHVYDGGWEHFVGGGVATFDCNGDHLPELFVAGGANPTLLLINTSVPEQVVSFAADLSPELKIKDVIGAYPLDIDNDGVLDLAVLRVGENLLLRGGENCTFSAFDTLGFNGLSAWTTAFSATWEKGRDLPTLAFGNYVDRENSDGPFGTCDKNQLYRPNGSVYQKPLELVPGYCPLSMLFSDWAHTGRADLRISNDRHYHLGKGSEQLLRLEPSLRFFTAQDGWVEHKLWGMGIASRDITGDGLPEVMMTSMGDQRLQLRDKNSKGPTFLDAPYTLGTTAQRPYTGGDGRPSTGWHVAFADVQNDGLDDIFIAKGNVEQMPDLAMADPNNLLVQKPDGRFLEIGESAGLASLHRGRGAAVVDLNDDGLLDVVVVNRRAPLEVFQNVTVGAGHWIGLSLAQDEINRNAIGAWIEVKSHSRVQARELTVGGGHASGESVPEHFGLGDAKRALVRVIWPDGMPSDWIDLAVDQTFQIARNGGALIATAY